MSMSVTAPSDRDFLVLEGIVTKCSRGGFYTVEYVSGAHRGTVLAKRSGRLNVHRIRLTEGDRVRLEVSPYDTTRGRITRRL
ncbi:MAG: translation initiation factor IF-1 [Myxococcota bacterium]|jgi:translation initiation factor IF-1|nr:translation initiation factor IF-1 [Myxococcota bacterium]